MTIPTATLWFEHLEPTIQTLIKTGLLLADRHAHDTEELPDYTFLVFPIAKAYEGFLKQYLLESGLIDKETHSGKKFRIGRALNPDIKMSQRDEFWLYDDLVLRCDPKLAREIWETWLSCRNRTFHYFGEDTKLLQFQEAQALQQQVLQVIQKAIECPPPADRPPAPASLNL